MVQYVSQHTCTQARTHTYPLTRACAHAHAHTPVLVAFVSQLLLLVFSSILLPFFFSFSSSIWKYSILGWSFMTYAGTKTYRSALQMLLRKMKMLWNKNISRSSCNAKKRWSEPAKCSIHLFTKIFPTFSCQLSKKTPGNNFG